MIGGCNICTACIELLVSWGLCNVTPHGTSRHISAHDIITVTYRCPALLSHVNQRKTTRGAARTACGVNWKRLTAEDAVMLRSVARDYDLFHLWSFKRIWVQIKPYDRYLRVCFIIPLPTHSVERRYSIFQQKFFFLSLPNVRVCSTDRQPL